MALRTVGHFISSNLVPTSFPGMIAPPAPIPNSLTLAPGEVEIGLDGQYLAPPGAIFSIASNVAQTTRISVIALMYEEVPV